MPVPARLGEVVTPSKPPPPISGGTLAISADGQLAVAADPDRNQIHLVSVADKIVTSLALPENAEPTRVVLDENKRAHVVLRGTGELAHIDLEKRSLASSTRVCEHPRGVAYDPDAAALVVACAGGDVVWLSSDDYSEQQRHFVDVDLRDVVRTKHGLYVSRYRSAELVRLDDNGKIAARHAPPDSHTTQFPGLPLPAADEAVPAIEALKLVPVTGQSTLAWRSMPGPDDTVLTLHQRSQVEEVSVQAGGYGGGCSSITQVASTLTGPEGPAKAVFSMSDAVVAVDAALSPDGTWLAVAAPGNYLIEGPTILVYAGKDVVAGHRRHCRGRGCGHHDDDDDDDDTETDAATPEDAGLPLADASAPNDAGFSDAGMPLHPIFGEDAGFPSDGCGFATHSSGFEIQATAVAFAADGKLFVQSREPAALLVYSSNTQDSDVDQWLVGSSLHARIDLSKASAKDTGHDLFHANVGGSIACASCHGEALDDGHTWDFEGIGPRRTQTMRGGFLKTAPFHWDGDMKDFQHLVDTVMTGRMGGFQVEPRYANALASWIDEQPPVQLSARDTASSKRGEALFGASEVGCMSCHNGTALTNNLSADVGTGGKFQIPSLHGLGLRGPFMHDGCAPTLRDRFEDASCGGGDKHGKTSHLTAQQRADLAAYLETL